MEGPSRMQQSGLSASARSLGSTGMTALDDGSSRLRDVVSRMRTRVVEHDAVIDHNSSTIHGHT